MVRGDGGEKWNWHLLPLLGSIGLDVVIIFGWLV